jgi:hypothetical protein
MRDFKRKSTVKSAGHCLRRIYPLEQLNGEINRRAETDGDFLTGTRPCDTVKGSRKATDPSVSALSQAAVIRPSEKMAASKIRAALYHGLACTLSPTSYLFRLLWNQAIRAFRRE